MLSVILSSRVKLNRMKIIMAAIKNVAKLAGISPSTTSCTLYDMISQTTKERVHQAIKELNLFS